MHTSSADPRTVVIAPAVVAAALDCLAHLACLDPVRPAHMHLIARALGCAGPEAQALTLRLVATAIVFHDPRWPAWSRFHKAQSLTGRRIFESTLTQAVACTPIDAAGRFHADAFFDDLLHILADPQVIDAAEGASDACH